MDIPDKLAFTVAEVAAALSMSRFQVYRLIHDGEIPAGDVIRTSGGGEYRITRAGFFRLARIDDPRPPFAAGATS